VWLRALQSWSASVFSETVFSAGRLQRTRQGYSEPGDEVIAVEDDRTVNFFGLKNDVTWEASGSQLVRFGFQVRPLEAEYRYASGPAADPASGISYRIEPSGTSLGLYAAHRAALTDRLATELGVRWDRQTYTGDSQFSPRLNALWRAGDRTDLRVGLGRFHQSQRIHELDVEDGETEFSPAELSRQIDLTFQHRSAGRLRFRLDAYYGEISRPQPRYESLFNPIELFPETAPDRILVAPQSARLRGLELLLRGDPARRFTWWASYAWSSAEDSVDGESQPRSWDQPHAGRLFAAYRWDERWSVSVLGTVRSGWPTTPVTAALTTLPDGSTEIVAMPGARNSDRFPTYVRVDAKASRSFRLSNGRLRLDLEITNLTDRKNACCVDEFLFTTAADGSIEAEPVLDNWLGLTPSFSVLWEF
jgi:outer membrane receptor protein involved in Fe transport